MLRTSAIIRYFTFLSVEGDSPMDDRNKQNRQGSPAAYQAAAEVNQGVTKLEQTASRQAVTPTGLSKSRSQQAQSHQYDDYSDENPENGCMSRTHVALPFSGPHVD
jgi:hypothetical protein